MKLIIVILAVFSLSICFGEDGSWSRGGMPFGAEDRFSSFEGYGQLSREANEASDKVLSKQTGEDAAKMAQFAQENRKIGEKFLKDSLRYEGLAKDEKDPEQRDTFGALAKSDREMAEIAAVRFKSWNELALKVPTPLRINRVRV